MPLLDEIFSNAGSNNNTETSQPVSVLDEALPKTPAAPATTTASTDNVLVSDENGPRLAPRTVPNYQEPSAVSKAGSWALGLPIEYGQNVAQNFKSGMSNVGQGLTAIQENRPAEGVGQAGLGLLGAAASPLTGLTKTFIQEPATKIGGKEFGEKADLAAGLVVPIAPAAKVAKNAMPTNRAINAVVDTIGVDNLKSVIDKLKSNDRLSLMDVVPKALQTGQRLIITEGPHQNKFVDWVNKRVGSAKDATTDIYDANMGTPVNVLDKLNSMKKAASDVGSNQIEPALAAAPQVNISPVVNDIDNILKPGVNSVISLGKPLPLTNIKSEIKDIRDLLTDDKIYRTDPQDLHIIQSGLRARAENLLNSQKGSERQVGVALMDVRNNIVNAIDTASGGKYKDALSNYRDEMQIQNAFEMGKLVTRNKLGRLEDSPEFWDNWVNKVASKEELEAAREGARLAIQHQISGFKAGARKGQDIVESEFNRDKLTSLFGKKDIDEMATKLADERNMAISNTKLFGGSQTAVREQANSLVDLPVKKQPPLLPLIAGGAELLGNAQGIPGFGLTLGGLSLASKGAHKFVTMPLAKAKNERLTDLLTATGPDRDELIKILESKIPQPKLSLASKARLALPILNP